jgi:serine/threonine protein phosphatase PrpC
MSFDLDLDIGYASERGLRDVNEDFVATRRPGPQEEQMGFICAIADGVPAGGEGRMAAQTSAKTLVEDYFCASPAWSANLVLERLIGAQNHWLAAHNRARHGSAACALTALVLRGSTWTVAHVGDTRAYLLRAGKCQRLTQDHRVVPADPGSPLARALGLEDSVRIDTGQGQIQGDDSFVLLSQGVHARLDDASIAWLAAQGSASLASRSLVAMALGAGGADNASALVIRVHGPVGVRQEMQSADRVAGGGRVSGGQAVLLRA